jgi:hypothetical protein
VVFHELNHFVNSAARFGLRSKENPIAVSIVRCVLRRENGSNVVLLSDFLLQSTSVKVLKALQFVQNPIFLPLELVVSPKHRVGVGDS